MEKTASMTLAAQGIDKHLAPRQVNCGRKDTAKTL
jgi:hypothetical protein